MTELIEERVKVERAAAAWTRIKSWLLQVSKAVVLLRAEICILAATISYANLILTWLWSEYARNRFGFHDLTLITDFFTNALSHARPFWVTDYAINHLTVHFTPTLVLLVPAFTLFDTQFALIAIVGGTIFLAIAIATREQIQSLKDAGAPWYCRVALAASFFALLAYNRYTLRCLESAHFEPVYILAAVLVLVAVRRGASLAWTIGACLLALGVRQDAGLFLFFLLVSCQLAPESWRRFNRKRTALAALSCGVYVVLVAKVIMPLLGSKVETRFWSRWGETWPDVFLAWAESPHLVFEAITKSEFLAFNAEFAWLQTLNGMVWILNQLPSILFYTADAWDKQQLKYYNPSFVLPGMLLSLAFAQLYGLAFIRHLTRHAPLWRNAVFTLFSALFVYPAVHVTFYSQPEDKNVLLVETDERSDIFSKEPVQQLLKCPEIKSVAADFRSIIFVPLRFDKYLPRNATKADMVVQKRKDKRNLPMGMSTAERKALVREAGYRKVLALDGYDVFFAPTIKCM